MVGVEYVHNEHAISQAKGAIGIARAKRLVVLSAGALGSPAILERSGIGGSKLLQTLGISQVVDLPGVGENYHGTNMTSSKRGYTHNYLYPSLQIITRCLYRSSPERMPKP